MAFWDFFALGCLIVMAVLSVLAVVIGIIYYLMGSLKKRNYTFSSDKKNEVEELGQ